MRPEPDRCPASDIEACGTAARQCSGVSKECFVEVGIHSFAALLPEALSDRIPAVQRLAALLDEIVFADNVGSDYFGEHHRSDYVDASPAVILTAAAACTSHIRLSSAVSVLSTVGPVRLFQDLTTLDLLLQGRTKITVGARHLATPWTTMTHSSPKSRAYSNDSVNSRM